MRSRQDFLALFENITVKKPFINYFQTEDVGYSVTLSEISRVSDEIRLLLDQNIGPRFHYVGTLVTDNAWLPCLLLGIWKSGKACACMGPQYPRDVNLNFINALRVAYIITDTDETVMCSVDPVCKFRINRQQYFICKRRLESGPSSVEPAMDMCYGIMTSGSTGAPKIIQVPWSCILPNACELKDSLSIMEWDNIYLCSPYTFDPFFIELFMSMIAGCLLTIVSFNLKMTSQAILEVLFKEKEYMFKEADHCYMSDDNSKSNFSCQTMKILNSCVTMLQITPSVFKHWGNDVIKHVLGKHSSLKVLLLGGEKFPVELMKLKSKDNITKVYNIYGITEISCWAFLTEVNGSDEVSLGYPLHEIVYKIDEKSELYIGSHTRKCIVNEEVNNKMDDNIVFRKTGDIVEMRNNKIYYVCRNNQVVKKFGMKINLNNVEKQLLSCSKQIEECFCIFDEETARLAVFYVNTNVKNGYHVLTGEEWRRLQGTVERQSIENPDYVIEIPAIPLNVNGKCDRGKLLQMFKKIMLKRKWSSVKIKECFHDVWTGIVGSTNFLQSGGDSVKALQIVTQLDECGIQVPKNFLTVLLKNGEYGMCLNALAESEWRSDSKMLKSDNDGLDCCELSVLWTFDMGKCIDAPTAVFTYEGSEHVVVGSHSSMLSSVTIETGQVDWTINLGGRIESGVCVNSSATFGIVGCYDRHVYCISMRCGRLMWKYRTDGMIKSTPCLSSDQNRVYVASYDTHLYCFKSQDGALLAKVKLSEGGIFSSPVRSDDLGTVYVATLNGTCLCLNQGSNNIMWRHHLDSPVFASPAVAVSGGGACPRVVFAEVTGRVNCFHAASGDKMWSYESNGNIYSTPVFASKDIIIFGCYDNHLYCLTRTTSETSPALKWKTELDSAVFAAPCLTGRSDILVLATVKGWIRLCRIESGACVGGIKLSGQVFSSPRTSGNSVVVGCRDNKLYAIGMKKITRSSPYRKCRSAICPCTPETPEAKPCTTRFALKQ